MKVFSYCSIFSKLTLVSLFFIFSANKAVSATDNSSLSADTSPTGTAPVSISDNEASGGIEKRNAVRFGLGFQSSRDVYPSGYVTERGSSGSMHFAYETFLAESLGLETQLMYRTTKTSAAVNMGKVTHTWGHLTVPVSLKGYIGQWKQNAPFVKAGLGLNYNTSRKFDYVDNEDSYYNISISGKDQISGKNWGVLGILGAGKTFAVNQELTLTPELLWFRGLTSQSNTSDIYESTVVFLVSLGF